MALDTYKKEQKKLKKDAEIEAGIPQVPEDKLSLKQILSNKESSALFGKMLELEGGNEDLMQKLLEGKIENSDIPVLEEKRAKFSERMTAAENIQKELTTEFVTEMGALDPQFDMIAKIVSSEKTAHFLKNQMKEMSITDPDAFDQIADSIEALKSFKNGEFKDLDKKITSECKENGYNVDKYMRILAVTDDGERHKALDEMVKSKWDKNGYGGLKRALNAGLFFSVSGSEARNLDAQKAEIDAAYAKLDDYKKLVGEILAVSVGSNKDLLDAMSREIVGEPKKKEVVGMADVKEMMPTSQEIQNEWIKYRGTISGWAALSPADKDLKRDGFLEDFSDDIHMDMLDKGGFWSGVFSSMFFNIFSVFDKRTLEY